MTTKIIFKCDDLEGVSDNVSLFDKIVQDTGIKVSWGIIGRFLENADEQYISWIKDKNIGGNYEFWNHGYYHGRNYGPGYIQDTVYEYEFQKPSVLQQVSFIKKTQKIMQEKLGIKMQCFGAPANHISWKTVIALFLCRDIKAWFYGIKFDKYIFTRSVEIEFPCGHVDFEKFKDRYLKWGKQRDLIVYQLHPNMWKKKDFEEFRQVVDFLKQDNVKFLLPRDIYQK